MTHSNSLSSQKIALICTYLFVALTVIGWIGIAHFYAPAPGDLSPEQLKHWFIEEYRWRTLLGCTLLYIGSALLIPGSLQWGFMLAKIEGKTPIMSATAAVCGVLIALIVFLNACAWIVCAYRAESDPTVIQAFYDWAWFAFLFGWVILALEMISSAIVEFQDNRAKPMIPRWMAYLTLFSATTMLGAIGPAFFKAGPFSYTGVFGLYIPVIVWGLYLLATNWFMYRHLSASTGTSSHT